jgi:CubicO group peptidase (beta-lactamase class C family)
MLYTDKAISQSAAGINQMLKKYIKVQHERIYFSGTVLVANQKDVLFVQSIGAASHELNVPIQNDSKFKIASVTKAFTGLLIALSNKEGKLRFEDKLQVFFPELKDEKWKQITVRQLIAHTSGIPHWNGISDYWNTKSKLSLNKEQVLNEIFKMHLLFEPGTKVEYSSLAYYLLATILEKVYGKSYNQLLREKILEPLQLRATGACDQTGIIPKLVSGYHLMGDDSLIVAPYRDMSPMTGGGNMYSTATDLWHWCRSLLIGSTWDDAIRRAAFTPLTTEKMSHKDGALYGIGWYIREKTDQYARAYHIGGGTYGFSSKVAIYPDEQLYIIILSNVSFLPVDDVLWKDIEKIVLGKPFELPEKFSEQIILNPEVLKPFEGLYASENGMELNVFIHQSSIYVKLGRNPPLEIYAKGNNEFFAKKIDVQFNFVRDEKGKISGLRIEGRGRTDYFLKQ